MAEEGSIKVILGTLELGKIEHININVYIRYEQDIILKVIGDGEVHLSGFF